MRMRTRLQRRLVTSCSGIALALVASCGGVSGGGSQIYLGTSDGTLYAFGFYIEH